MQTYAPTTFGPCPPRPTPARNASASSARGSATRRCVQGMLETPFYIACLQLTGRRCVVVGGGDVGLEKVEGLLACDGRVVLIAPDAVPELPGARRARARSSGSGASTGPGDLEATFIAIAATERHRRQHPRLRGRRAAGDARQRRRRAAAVQLHPAGDRAHRPAGDRDLHRRRLAGAGQAHQAPRSRRSTASPTRGWPCCSTRRAAGRRPRCRPTRTARSSSRASSTASPTRSRCCARGDEAAVRELIAAAQRAHARRGRLTSRPPAGGVAPASGQLLWVGKVALPSTSLAARRSRLV